MESPFLGYIGDPDFHDGTILAFEQQSETVHVKVQGASGSLLLVVFSGVAGVRANNPEGMVLYALCELSGKLPLRRFAFANWDQDNAAFLEIDAESITVFQA